MAKLEMGNGFKALVAFLLWAALFGSGFIFGLVYTKGKQTDSNIEVLSIDSDVAQEISIDTKTNKEKLDGEIKALRKPIIDSDGYVSAEFMQLIQSAKSDAERRGHETGIIRAITKP